MKNTRNLIIFLAVILVLTIVARGTAGATMPKVSVTTPQAAEISDTVSGTASVTSAGTIDITAPVGLTVETIPVGVGQKVSAGDPVATFDYNDVQETLIRQTAQLDSQNLKLEKLERSSSADHSAVDNAKKSLDSANTAYDNTKKKADSLPSVSKAKAAVNTAQTADKAAQDALSSAEPGPDQDAAQQALDAADAALQKAQDNLAAAQQAASDLTTAQSKIDDAQTAYDKATSDYNNAAQQASDTNRQNSIDATTLQLDIADQEKVIADLNALVTTNGALLAPYDGVVQTVSTVGRTTDTSPVVQLMDNSAGSKADMTIDSTDAEKLSVGDDCSVSSGGGMYFRATDTATIFAIAPPDDRDMVLVTLLLPDGDWTRGQSLSAQVVISRVSYNVCVPLSALHSDNSGYFVYTVAEKSTVLGIENVVTRIPVNLTAEDDTNAAIDGPLDRNASVVTDSSKSIDDGSRVRINGA